MNFKIETQHLILRDFSQSDLPHYVAQCQDPKYQRFYNEQDCSEAQCIQLVELFIEQAQQTPRRQYHLAITDKASGDYLGIAGLRVEEQQQASIGCGLIRGQQGKGASEEAMKALLKFGFEHLAIHRAYAETLAANRAAVRLCTKLGMRVEARLIEHRYFKHQWWDTTILAILAQEFDQLANR